MTEEEFKRYAHIMIRTVQLDLDELQKIADEANEAPVTSSSTTVQTTRNPADVDYPFVPDISRCTIPIAMVCFSVVDVLGFWAGKGVEYDFAKTSSIFFKTIANRNDLNNSAMQENMKEAFRHSMMHSFFPLTSYSVSYPAVEYDILFIEEDGKKKILNVRYLLKVVRIGLQKMEEELDNPGSQLIKDSYVGFKKWIDKNHKP